jgi:ribosomal protein L12E/L44/L45/RPP1/RPP2
MKFILTFTLPPATRDAAMARFLETGGQPPPGVTLLGRWTQLDLCGGFVLLESEDPQALTAFAHAWSDVVELAMAPVLEDQALSEVLRRARAQPSRAAASGAGLPQAAAIVADQELPDSTHPETDQTREVIAVPPPPAVPGGLEGEGEEPGRAGNWR